MTSPLHGGDPEFESQRAHLDSLGFQKSAVGQWIVRTLSGEGESIFEGIYSIRQSFRHAKSSMSEAYGWGKFLFIFLGSRGREDP